MHAKILKVTLLGNGDWSMGGSDEAGHLTPFL